MACQETPQDEATLSPEIVATLVASHRKFLGFLEQRVGDRTVAEDILQEAFVRSVDKAATLQKEEAAIAWFYRILRNAVIDHHRRGAAARRRLDAFAAELETTAPKAPPVLHSAVCECIGGLMDTLKPEYAQALRRVELDGVSVKDYAAEAGITGNNASVRVSRAREALRKRVTRACGTCAEHGCLDCTCQAPCG